MDDILRTSGEPLGGVLSGIEITLHAEVGSSFISLSRLLQVGRGGVIPLDKSATETIQLKSGNIVVAEGTLEVVEQQYVVRLEKINYRLG